MTEPINSVIGKSKNKWIKVLYTCIFAIILVVTSMGGSFLIFSNVYTTNLKQNKGETGEPGPEGPQGVSILSIDRILAFDDYDLYMISYSNGLSTTFEVKHGNNGKDGETPVIGENGNWWIDGIDTGVLADAAINIPYVGINGNWWLGGEDTGFKAQGQDGKNGQTPYIGENGNWWIGDEDTSVLANGATGTGIVSVTILEKSNKIYNDYVLEHNLNVELTDVYKILFSDESVSYFHIINGSNGVDGIDGVDGVDGMNGTNGTNGTDANRWLSGTTEDPLNAWGNPGDFYLCTSTNIVYQKDSVETYTNKFNGKMIEFDIDADTFINIRNNSFNYGLEISETGITYVDDITLNQIEAMTIATNLNQTFYNYLWNYKLDSNNNAHLYGYLAAEGALDINGSTITKIHYEWKELTTLKGMDGSNGQNGENGKSAYEVWRDYTDNEGNQPNLYKSISEFFQSIRGVDGDGISSIELVSNGNSSNNYVDTYKITYTVQEPYYFTVRNGRDGMSAYQVWLQQNGYSIDDESRYDDFFASFAIGAIDGLTILENGNWGIKKYENYEDIPDSQKSNYVQGSDGFYYEDSGVQAKGDNGDNGKSAYDIYCEDFRSNPANAGEDPLNEHLWLISLKGEAGADGKDARLEISDDGFWVIGDVKTNYKVTGEKGEQGDTPYIDDNGYWCVGETNLGVLAKGPKGDKGDTGEAGISITGVNKINSDGVIDTYQITFSNGDTSTFVVTNGKDGIDGTNGIDGKDGIDGTNGIDGKDGKDGTNGIDGKDGKDGSDIFMGFGDPNKLNEIDGKDGDIYINLDNGEMYRYDVVGGWGAVVGTMRGTQWFTGDKTLEELNENPLFNVDGLNVIANDLYLNTSTYDIYKFDGIRWNQLGNLSENVNQKLSEEYRSAINNSPYTKIGEKLGVKPGYFRLYNNPKKIVVIGNSITMHGPREADGINWNVADMREMAASRPDSGWVTLIKKYINDGLGLTDCKIYKGNGSTWEVAANGSRSIDHILDQDTYEVLTTGVDLSTKGTFADVLTDDVDLILLQLSENMPAPTTDNDKMLTANDWSNLYGSLKNLCPKAKIYQMTGFWTDLDKMQPLLSVAENPVFNPLLIPGCMQNYSDLLLEAQTGDNIYDANGEVITNVSQAVSRHPNDDGFLVIAEQFLDALFNDRSKFNDSDFRVAAVKTEDTNIFNPYFEKEIFHRSDPGVTEVNFSEINSYLDYFMLHGKYSVVIRYPDDRAGHSVLKIEGSVSDNDGYSPIIQIISNSNQGTYRSITRNVELSDSATVYNPWQFERQDFWITQRIDVSGLQITDAQWTLLSSNLYKIPIQIKEVYYIVEVTNSLDYSSQSILKNPRVLFSNTNTSISIAASPLFSDEVPYTIPPNTYLEIVYA